MKNKFLVILVVALVSACTTQQVVQAPQKTSRVVLAYQSNRLSEVEPCGCKLNPSGGLDRESNAVQAWRSENPNQLIYIDTGNSLMADHPKISQKLQVKKADLILSGLKEAGLDVFAIGPYDLRLGVDYFKKAAANVAFPIFATNVVDDKKQTLFKPYAVIEKNGLRIGFLSVLKSLPTELKNAQLLSEDETLEKWVPVIRKEADVVVLVTHTPFAVAESWAKKGIPVDLVISNDLNNAIEQPFTYQNGKTMMVNNANHGFYFGKIVWDVSLPYQGSYSPTLVEKNRAEVKKYEEAVQINPENADNKIYLNSIKKTSILEEIPGGSKMEHKLVKLSKEEFGAKNAITPKLSQFKEELRKSALME